MDFSKPLTVELTGQELATIITGLMELPGKVAYDLIKKLDILGAEAQAQDAKVPGPELRTVNGELMPR